MKIAVMPGDGVGKEVVPEGLKVLKVAGREVRLHVRHHRLPVRRRALPQDEDHAARFGA